MKNQKTQKKYQKFEFEPKQTVFLFRATSRFLPIQFLWRFISDGSDL